MVNAPALGLPRKPVYTFTSSQCYYVTDDKFVTKLNAASHCVVFRDNYHGTSL